MSKVKLDLRSLTDQQLVDVAGATSWHFAKVESKSKTALTGLTSGKRYWLRVIANGSAGPGPASDATTKVAP